MKKIFLIAGIAVFLFSACEDKSKAEKTMDNAADKVKDVSKEIGDEAKNVGDSLKKDGKEAKEKAKDAF